MQFTEGPAVLLLRKASSKVPGLAAMAPAECRCTLNKGKKEKGMTTDQSLVSTINLNMSNDDNMKFVSTTRIVYVVSSKCFRSRDPSDWTRGSFLVPPRSLSRIFFFFFLKSTRLISLRLVCGGLEPLTEPSLGAVDPRKKHLRPYLSRIVVES